MKKIIYISLLISIISCKTNSENQKETETVDTNNITLTEAQFKNASIETGQLEQKSISSILKVNGKIDVPPQNMVSISMPLGGYLKSSHLLPGMHLKKGEIIAKMEDQQYVQIQQDYLTTKSRLYFAENEYKRQKELNQSQASSDKVYQQAEMEYRNLQISLTALAEKLRLININPNTLTTSKISKTVNIYSPINGFVSKVNVNIGKYVNPSDVLFELVNPSDIHLNLKIFEKDVPKLFIGQDVMAYTNNNNTKYPCEVLLISKDLSSEEHSADVHCHFKKYDKNLLPGMYMNAEIEVKNNNSYTLPEEAIVNFEGKNYIFIENKDRDYKMELVDIGNQENGIVEILNYENLIKNKIVVKGAYTLLMKLKNKSDE